MMSFLKRFGLFWYDFIVGDDWFMAAGTVVALVITWAAVQADVVAWLWLPLALVLLMVGSLWRATAGARKVS
jgi:hypothetical protein